jgi:hypothetical protein
MRYDSSEVRVMYVLCMLMCVVGLKRYGGEPKQWGRAKCPRSWRRIGDSIGGCWP